MKITVDISRADAAYFSYLTYEIKGFEVLMRIQPKKEFCKKLQELKIERSILAEELVKKYVGDQIKQSYVSVSLTYQRMEVTYE